MDASPDPYDCSNIQDHEYDKSEDRHGHRYGAWMFRMDLVPIPSEWLDRLWPSVLESIIFKQS